MQTFKKLQMISSLFAIKTVMKSNIAGKSWVVKLTDAENLFWFCIFLCERRHRQFEMCTTNSVGDISISNVESHYSYFLYGSENSISFRLLPDLCRAFNIKVPSYQCTGMGRILDLFMFLDFNIYMNISINQITQISANNH